MQFNLSLVALLCSELEQKRNQFVPILMLVLFVFSVCYEGDVGQHDLQPIGYR